VRITLLAPERHFRYRPMAVAESFTIAHARKLWLAVVAADIACGTRIRPAFAGARTIDDGKHAMNATADISIVTPESAPLGLFGAGISDELSRLLRDAGITFHGSSFAEMDDGELKLQPSGLRLRPGRVVALPLLDGPQIAGVPADPHGFIPVGEQGEVPALEGVYAAGDATSYPIKHGGLAAQQADVVAAAIAARAGIAIEPEPLRPVLRGALPTGGEPRFVEAELAADGSFSSTVSDACPWDPPEKIVARHLGPYLARGARDAVGQVP
jgi:sulfide:quinone oxidoreductase